MNERGIHPEDAMAYADQLHRDCARIAVALERIADVLEHITSGEDAVAVKQSGAWAQTSYQVMP